MLTVNWNCYHYYQKISKGPGGACVRRRGAPVPWHNGQSKPVPCLSSARWCQYPYGSYVHANVFLLSHRNTGVTDEQLVTCPQRSTCMPCLLSLFSPTVLWSTVFRNQSIGRHHPICNPVEYRSGWVVVLDLCKPVYLQTHRISVIKTKCFTTHTKHVLSQPS